MIFDFGVVIGQIQVDTLADQYRGWFVKIVVFALTVGVTYLVGRVVVIPPIVRAVARRNPDNRTIVDAIGLYLRVAFFIIAIPIAVAAAGVGGIVVGSTVIVAAATLALGIAGRDVIGNFVSGVFLVADPDFNVGDYIEWEDRAGTIKQIDLRVTRMQTPGGDMVVVPNTDITTSAVRHPYSSGRHRLAEQITVGYREPVERVSAMIVEEIETDSRIASDPAPTVHVNDLGDAGIELTIWFWIDRPKSKDLLSIRTEFATRVKNRLLDEGVDIAPANPQELSGHLAVTTDEMN